MKLFDDIARTENRLKLHSDPSYKFLNNSNRENVKIIRDDLESWFSKFPKDGRADIVGRFKSKDSFNHESAFYELFLHELLLRLDCKVKIHPSLEGTTRKPDFFVASSEQSFYIEAVLATMVTNEEKKAQKREQIILDAINGLDSPDYFLSYFCLTKGDKSTSTKGIKKFLAENIDKLDHNDLLEKHQTNGYVKMPKWIYEKDGWKIRFRPILKGIETRGKKEVQTIAIRSGGAWRSEFAINIRETINGKREEYGKLDLPYVIAVNILDPQIEYEDFAEALYGTIKEYVILEDDKESTIEQSRELDGTWTSKEGYINANISAVLGCNNITPYNFRNQNLCFFLNPWAEKPCNSVFSNLPRSVLINSQIQYKEGQSLYQIFKPMQIGEIGDRHQFS